MKKTDIKMIPEEIFEVNLKNFKPVSKEEMQLIFRKGWIICNSTIETADTVTKRNAGIKQLSILMKCYNNKLDETGQEDEEETEEVKEKVKEFEDTDKED